MASTPTTGNDNLTVTNANETIDGLAGNDTFGASGGSDNYTGGAGNDTFIFGEDDNDADIINEAPNGGVDTVDFSARTQNLTIDLTGGTVTAEGIGALPSQISTTVANGDSRLLLTTLDDGGFVATWQTYINGWVVNGQRYTATGQKTGGEFHVANASSMPAVTAIDGGFVAVWQAYKNNGNSGIQAQRFDGNGAKVGGVFDVHSSLNGEQQFPSVARKGDGFIVVFSGDGWFLQ